MPLLLSSMTVERGEGGYRFTRRKACVRMTSLLKEGEETQRDRMLRRVGHAF